MLRVVLVSALLAVAVQAARDPNGAGKPGTVGNKPGNQQPATAKNDAANAANGPNGKACAKGAVVDTIKGDGQFTCDCAGTKMTGDNCEKLASAGAGPGKPTKAPYNPTRPSAAAKDAAMASRVAKQLAKATEASFCTGKGAGDECARISGGKVTHECASVPLASVFKSGSRILTAANGAIATAQKGENGPKEGEITCTCNPGCTNGKYCDPGVGQSNCQCVCQSDDPKDCEPGGRDHTGTEVATAGEGGGDRLRRAFDKAALQKQAKEATCTDDETKELSVALADSELRLQSASSLASSLTDVDADEESLDESPDDVSGATVATVALSAATMMAAASLV